MTVDMVHPEIEAIEPPNTAHLITEDDTPVDNIPSEKQQRLLVEPLYSSWQAQRPFVAAANVGIFSSVSQQAIVPDMFLSLDVQVAEDWWAHEHRSYFIWEFGKPPDVVVEIVSNRRGQEAGEKLRAYARMSVSYYAIYDPQGLIQKTPLVVYESHAGMFVPRSDTRLERVSLALILWEGEYEGRMDRWLRWCTPMGEVIPTGAELSQKQRERAEHERERAEHERERAERLAAQLRALGVEPEA